MAAYNAARAARLQDLTITELLRIVAGQTLSAAAAQHELRRRKLCAVRTRKGWFLAPAEPWRPNPRPPTSPEELSRISDAR